MAARLRNWPLRPLEIFDTVHLPPPRALRRAAAIVATVTSPAMARRLLPYRRKVLNLSSSRFGAPFPTVAVDGPRHGAEAAGHLLAQGARHLAIFEPRPDYPHHTGFLRAAAAAAAPATLLANARQVLRWMRASPEPAGLFTLDNWNAVSLLNHALSEGIDVPDRLLIMGGEGDPLPGSLAQKGLSYMAPPYEAICERAGALLHAFIHHAQPLPARPEWFAPRAAVIDRSTDFVDASDPAVRRAIGFIHDHAHEPIEIEAVARHAGLPRRALERRFQKFHSRGIHGEILRSRLTRARRLLATTDWTAGRIAYECGFASQSHFGKVFLAAEGRTPLQVRRAAGA